MLNFVAIKALLLSLPIAASDRAESGEARDLRLGEMAEAIRVGIEQSSWIGSESMLAGVLIAMGQGESDFSPRIQACQCKRYECDPKRTRAGIVFLARGTWQAHNHWLARPVWDEICGSASIQASVAAEMLSRWIRHCGSIEAGIGAYSTGRGCGYGEEIGLVRGKVARLWASRLDAWKGKEDR
jgi:hypothetical protein